MPRAIVRKRNYANMIMPYAVSAMPKRYKTAYSIGKYAYANRAKIGYAARRIGRAYRRYRRRQATQSRSKGTKSRMNNSSTYQFGSPNGMDVLDRKTLAGEKVLFSSPTGPGASVRTCDGQSIYVNGFKLCCVFRNLSRNPTHVHFAIVQERCPDSSRTLEDIREDIFSNAFSTDSDKYVGFTNASDDPAWDKEQDCRKLNPQKFHIMKHDKFILAGAQDMSTDINNESEGNRKSYRFFETWMRVGKTFSFEDLDKTNVDRPFWVLVWHESLFPTVAAEQIQYTVRTHTYFKSKN